MVLRFAEFATLNEASAAPAETDEVAAYHRSHDGGSYCVRLCDRRWLLVAAITDTLHDRRR